MKPLYTGTALAGCLWTTLAGRKRRQGNDWGGLHVASRVASVCAADTGSHVSCTVEERGQSEAGGRGRGAGEEREAG